MGMPDRGGSGPGALCHCLPSFLLCVCVYVCVCVRACVRVRARARLGVCAKERERGGGEGGYFVVQDKDISVNLLFCLHICPTERESEGGGGGGGNKSLFTRVVDIMYIFLHPALAQQATVIYHIIHVHIF